MRELSVAEYGRFTECAYANLSENLAGCGERLDEDGFFIRDRVWNGVEIFERQREEFGEGAVVSDDSENFAARAVGFQSAAAKIRKVGGSRERRRRY